MLVVPCPVLVGRAAELDALVSALDDATAGRGSLVVVAGDAGIGKSRLAHEVCDTAATRGLRVLRGRAVPDSGSPYRPLTEALAPLLAEIVADGDLARWLPALGAILPTITPVAAAEATTPVQGEAVLRALATACAPAGGVLLLEDLHWADPETMAIVEHLADNLERAPVLCLATMRPDGDGPGRDLLRRASDRRSPKVLRLPQLNDAQVAAMVHSCTGDAGPDVLQRVLDASEGVPFVVEEMLASPGLPASFAETVAARVGELPDGDRAVLATAAACGREFDWHLLAAATGLDDEAVAGALERGVSAQLLDVDGDGFRFRHALTAEAVFHAVLPPRREAVAAAALSALDAAHPEVPVHLRHVAARLAERAGSAERAGRTWAADGADALGRGALDSAVTALERACDLLPAGEERDAAAERCVEALVLAGRIDRALAVSRSVVDGLAPPRAAAVHLRLAGGALTASRLELAESALTAASRALTDEDAALQAELLVRRADLVARTDEGLVEAGALASAALDRARAARAPELECEALQLAGRLARRSSLGEAERWFREAREVAGRARLPVWELRATHELGTIGLLDRSEIDELLEAQGLAESMGAMATASILDIEIAAGLNGRHDIPGAEHHGRQAAERAGALGLDVVEAYGWHHVAAASMLRRDPEAQRSAADAARAAAPGNTDIEGLLAGLDGFGALLDDDLGLALSHAERSAELLRASTTAPPAHFRPAWPLLLAVQHRPEAPAALAELQDAGLAGNRACRGTLSMAGAVLAGHTAPDDAAALAVGADADLGFVPLWRCVVRRLAAQAAAVDGWEVPAAWLVESERWSRDHGYRVLAGACAALRTGRPSTVPAEWARLGVTPREGDVLALVIEGCSNREIAERLFLSVRTVEKHVESLLRKTQAKTRTQLARIATA